MIAWKGELTLMYFIVYKQASGEKEKEPRETYDEVYVKTNKTTEQNAGKRKTNNEGVNS